LDQLCCLEHCQVVGHIQWRDTKGMGDFAHIVGLFRKQSNYLQPFWSGQGGQLGGTFLGLQGI